MFSFSCPIASDCSRFSSQMWPSRCVSGFLRFGFCLSPSSPLYTFRPGQCWEKREMKKVEKAKKFLSRMIFSLADITSATHWLDVNEIEDLPLKNGWARDNSFQHWDPSVHFLLPGVKGNRHYRLHTKDPSLSTEDREYIRHRRLDDLLSKVDPQPSAWPRKIISGPSDDLRHALCTPYCLEVKRREEFCGAHSR